MTRAVLIFLALLMAPISSSAIETNVVTISGNLNPISAIATIPNDTATFLELETYASNFEYISVKDSLNITHPIGVFFFINSANSWTVCAYADGKEITAGTINAGVLLGCAPLFFTPEGTLTLNGTSSMFTATPIWSNGSRQGNIIFAFNHLTQVSGQSIISATISNSGSNCTNITNCLESRLPTVFAECSEDEISCNKTFDDFILQPSTLATRALQRVGCLNKSFRTKRDCHKCYTTAQKRIQIAESSRLFGDFFTKAKDEVKSRRQIACQ